MSDEIRDVPVQAMLRDWETDVEGDVIMKDEMHRLAIALEDLDEEMYDIINSLFLKDEPETDTALAKRLGISQAAVSKRKKKILELLRKRLK